MIARRALAAVVLSGSLLAAPVKSRAAVFVDIRIAPPALPVYEQPVCPGPDYLWTPGYWAWDEAVADYYWVPGTWVAAPEPGFLWTPGYWGYENAVYVWHGGYWGPHIGFYGGVNYGFGFFGTGFEGGYWNGGHFFYNTAISRVNPVVIHNTYVHNVTVVNNNHFAFNGPGGIQARPNPGEMAALRENHREPTGPQMQQSSFARQDRGQFASANHGVPPAAAMARPAQSVNAFHNPGSIAPARAAGGPTNNGASGFRGGAQPGGNGFRPQAAGQPGAQGFEGGNRPAAAGQSSTQGFSRPAGQPATQIQNRPAPAAAPQARTAPESRPAPQSHASGGHEEHRR